MGRKIAARPCLLIVEDDTPARALMTRILIEADFRVVTAANGAAALRCIGQQQFDVAIIDLELRGRLDGAETVRRARALQPDLKVLSLIGINATDVPVHEGRDDFIARPFVNREFLGCVFELLLRDPGPEAAGEADRAVEHGLSEAKSACLRQRRAMALNAGHPGLAAELDREIDRTALPRHDGQDERKHQILAGVAQ